jgi:hypothetical protein
VDEQHQAVQLDRFIDALQAGEVLEPTENGELAELRGVVLELRRQPADEPEAIDWPAHDYPAQLTRTLVAALQPGSNRAAADAEGDSSPPTATARQPWTRDLVPLPPPATRRRWLHEGARLVAAVILLVGVSVVLMVVFQTASPRMHAPQLGALSTGSALATPTDAIADEAFHSDPGALWAYRHGLGVHPDLTQDVDGFRVSLIWVYADTNRIIYLAAVSDVAGHQSRGLEFDTSHSDFTITDQDGQPLKFQNGYGTSGARDGVAYDGGAFEIDPSAVSPTRITFHLSEESFQVWNPISVPATPSACKKFGTIYSCPAPITGQLDLTASAPVLPGRVISLQQQGTVAGATLMLRRVAIAPSQMRLDFDQLDGTIFYKAGMDLYPMRLTSDGREASGGFMQSVDGQHITYVFNDTFANQPHDYTLTIQPRGTSVDTGVAPPLDSWVVHFTLPPATPTSMYP